MTSSPLHLRVLLAASAVLAGAPPAMAAAAPTQAPLVRVLASGLDQPKKLTFAAEGDLVVALSGDGVAPSSCTDGAQVSCADRSGAIDAVSPAGTVTTLLGGLSSVSSGGADAQATGPAEARLAGGRLQVLFQDSTISSTTGAQAFGTAGSQLGRLIGFSAGASHVEADLGAFEAAHDPDHGAGTDVAYGLDSAIGSDPYAFVPYRGGYAIADAGANDVLFVSHTGRVSVLAVLPTIAERAPAGTYGTAQKTAIEAQAQSVPDAIAVGPGGDLYVGELGGMPFAVGRSSIYRIVPGRRTERYATGFTSIADIAFDPQGRLLVLELDRDGLSDPGFNRGHPASGTIIRLARDGARTTLLARGLQYPTGIAVSRTGTIYVSDDGVSSATVGHGGEILEVTPR
ncbi:MAG TPA: ScyD/ScyE family protein [Solirubrobacteraceae bacterium]|jgi:glucose/arabinose dehydrogenase|nr:ScyD/ScyE family protein [Solirubrobacteraceae bacterium]